MLKDSPTFSSYSVKETADVKDFYAQVLGLEVKDTDMGIDMGLEVKLANDASVFIYPKPDHTPATFTVLNFIVHDIDETVDKLKAKGVTFEDYKDMTDEKGIARGLANNYGPDIAWFKDPAGNFLAVLQTKVAA